MLAQLLEQHIATATPTQTVALLLSGGVDSLSCGFAAQALGKNVHAYTFQLQGLPSLDSRSAQQSARRMGWPCTLIEVPVTHLEQDFLILAQTWHCQKKTQFECTFPFLYVIPQIKEMAVLSGIAADGHFGLSKKAMMHWRTPKARFDQFRADYFAAPNPAGQVQQQALCAAYGKQQIAPYFDPAIFAYFRQFTWEQINRPFQKMLTLQAYPEAFKRCGRRPHANLQLVAGIDHAFEQLLLSPLNVKQRKRVLDLCRDYAWKA